MFRKFFIGTLIVFVLSLLLWHNVSFADESDDRDISFAMNFAENKADNVDTAITNLGLMKDAMEVLIGEWSDNMASIESGIELTLVGVLGTTASVATSIFSGGTTTITTKTAALFTLKKAIDLGVAIFAHSGYVDAMEASINAVDTQIGVIEQKKVIYSELYDDDGTTYNGAYERYLILLATHTGFTAASIDERVNTSDSEDDKFPHKNNVTPTHKHFGDERREFAYEDLPADYPCDGPCDDMFRSPHKALMTHGTRCEGCSDIYYSCGTYEEQVEALDLHKARECNIKIWMDTTHGIVDIDCPNIYRNCTRNNEYHITHPPFTNTSWCREAYPDGVRPYSPQNFTLTPGVTTIRLDWATPVSSGSSEITDYEYSYRRKTLWIDEWTAWASAGLGFSKTIENLQAYTDYEFKLAARNGEGLGEIIRKSVKTEVFTPSLSLTYNSSTGSVSMTANANAPIFGADLYIYFPDRTYDEDNKYGTKIGWTSGNSNATTYSLPVNYSFPATAASGTYKFTLRVYPFNNSGSGDAWGVPYDVFEDVTVD